MANCTTRLIVVIIYLFLLYLSHNVVEGRRRSSTKEKVLNKPIIKSIKANYGDMYDCVDFYNQPAFDHPLLKNHSYNFQVRPSAYPTGTIINKQDQTEVSTTLNIWPNGKGCPVGTVPIRRTSKEDFIRAKKYLNTTSFTPTISGHVHAVVRTIHPKTRFNGVGGYIAIYNPHLFNANQYSSARISLQKSGDGIQIGWMVSPTLYGDSRTRFFVHHKAGQSECFDIKCPGFVITNPNIPLDFVFDNYSHPRGPQIDWKFSLYRANKTGDWWLNFGSNDTPVGFWPKRIFVDLQDLATYADWGGQVYSPPEEPAPYMGSGRPPFGDADHDAYIRHLMIMNEDYWISSVFDTEYFVDANGIHYYAVKDWWDHDSNWVHSMSFGGGLW